MKFKVGDILIQVKEDNAFLSRSDNGHNIMRITSEKTMDYHYIYLNNVNFVSFYNKDKLRMEKACIALKEIGKILYG